MKSFLLFGIYALSTLSAAEPVPAFEAEHSSLEERQLQAIPLLAGAGLAGLIGLGTLGTFAGALNSYGKSGPCRCPVPRCEGSNACECINTAAVSCWVQAKGDCQLSLNACKSDPNAPPTDPRSQFPPCLPNGGKNAALPACQSNARCVRVDNNCYDWNFRAQGGCIGICVPRSIGTQAPQQPKGGNWGSQPQQQQQPKGGNWGNQPAYQPTNGGGNWGNQPAQGGSYQPYQPSQPGSSPPGSPPGPAYYGDCPEQVRGQCPGNSLCVLPNPQNRNTYTCAPANEICGSAQNIQCSNNRKCVADPRTKCTAFGCTGLCA